MKNTGSIKGMLLALTAVALLASCKKENIDDVVTVIPPAPLVTKIEGDWEVYKFEKQELILNSVNGQLVQSMEWRDMTPPTPEEITMTFFNDKTFKDYYANVPVNSGNWDVVPSNPNEFTFEFTNGFWPSMQDIYTVRLLCDNTMAIEYRIAPPAGNHDFQNEEWYAVYYFRTPGTEQCDELVDYYVD